jgi:hypothetical protein
MASIGRDEGVTASAAGLSRQEQVPIVLQAIESKGGVAQMRDIYQAIEKQIGQKLSKQGRDSLREVVNRYMVNEKYVVKDRGWRITPKGRLKLKEETVATKARTAKHSSEPPVDIETFEGTVKDVDSLIQEQRLRIGRIDTGDELAVSRRRQGQQQLRELTLLNYSSTCAFCDVNDPSLLVTSHIVGWAEDPETRGLLPNIICLCRFHDVLFEKGYLSLADDLAVLKRSGQTSRTIAILLDNTVRFRKPSEHPPKPEFLRRHRLRCRFEG